MKSNKLSALAIFAVGFGLMTCAVAQAQLVQNGGFENYTGTAPKDFWGNVLPTDWSSGGYVFVDAPGTATVGPGIPVYGPFQNTSPNGGNFVEADGSAGLSIPITQSISGLTVGQNYDISFYQAAGQQQGDLGATTEQWLVSLGSNSQYSALMSIPQGGVNPWEAQTITLPADNTTDVLSFLAVGSGGNPPIVFLDGVSMESTVPEPSAVMILAGVGVLAAGFFRFRRRTRANGASAIA